jgi:hypothetical protein
MPHLELQELRELGLDPYLQCPGPDASPHTRHPLAPPIPPVPHLKRLELPELGLDPYLRCPGPDVPSHLRHWRFDRATQSLWRIHTSNAPPSRGVGHAFPQPGHPRYASWGIGGTRLGHPRYRGGASEVPEWGIGGTPHVFQEGAEDSFKTFLRPSSREAELTEIVMNCHPGRPLWMAAAPVPPGQAAETVMDSPVCNSAPSGVGRQQSPRSAAASSANREPWAA